MSVVLTAKSLELRNEISEINITFSRFPFLSQRIKFK